MIKKFSIFFFFFSIYVGYGQCNPDVVAPLIVCPDPVSASTDPGLCSAYIDSSSLSYPVVYDFCGVISVTASGIPPGNNFPLGTTTVTWTASDAYGNSTSCTQLVTVTDNEAPVLSCPADVTVSTDPGLCSATVSVPLLGISENCTVASVTNDYNGGGADASGVYPIGVTTVTFTVTDAANFTSSCSFNITVVSNEAPVISLLGPDPLTLGACSSYTEYGATASDNCEGDLTSAIVIDDSALDLTTVGSYQITYNVFNSGGLAATEVIRTVNVIDTTAPVLSLVGPNPLTIGDCSTYTELGAVASDCTGDLSASVVVDNSSVDTSTLGSYTVTYNVTDGSGNAATQITRTVTVIDINEPLITLAGDNPQVIQACSPYTELGATALDPCSNTDYSADIVIDTSGLDLSTVGSYDVTYNVSDIAGNAAIEVIRTIEVIDTIDPTINCPGNIVVGNDPGQCSAIVSFNVTSGDNCPGETIVQIDTTGLSSGDAFPLGTTTLEFEVTDVVGNTATCSFDITVEDNEAPQIVCQDISVQLDPSTGLASITASEVDNGSTDNCSLSLSLSQTSFSCSDIGDNIVTLTATDNAGNSSSCDANVIITDLGQTSSVSIIASETTICETQSITFTATPANGGSNPTYQWQVNGIDVPGETASTFSTNTLANGDSVSVVMISDLSSCTLTHTSNTMVITVNDYNLPANAGSNITSADCTQTTVALSGNAITGAGAQGTWSVTSGQSAGFYFTDINDPNSAFTGDVGEVYTLTWSIDNPAPCVDTSDSITVTFIGCDALDFDGIDDNVTFGNNYDFGGQFTIEVWIKSETTSNNIQTILSKRESNNQLDGYDLRLVNNIISFHYNNGQNLASPFPIVPNRWHHLAISYDGIEYVLYIDGIQVNSISGAAPVPNGNDCLLGAMDQTLNAPYKPYNYFDGGMDELRIWKVALTRDQIRKMMNQEIYENAGDVIGSEVNVDLNGLSWASLDGYYKMSQSADISSGNLNPNNASGLPGKLRYMTTLQPESAPLPYESVSDGFWTNSGTWLNGNVQAIPNSNGVDGTAVEWNIVRTAHNISSGNRNIILLGLNIENNTLKIENSDPEDGQSLRITDYLNIDGKLDLEGESQLLQDMGSILDSAGMGILERDQQGTANLYNYNYWGSPVSSNGISYSVSDILKDGTNPNNPIQINWTTAYDADGISSPITISNRWIYTFENSPQDSYADWVLKQETGIIDVGLGFTMKGSGTADTEQNYVFEGRPNNGTISSTVTATPTENFQLLVGNPYPSAIDAREFIKDNIPGVNGNPGSSGSIDGSLYFWQHFDSNSSHILEQYEGGYSIYNLSGAVSTFMPPEISGSGSFSKVPGDYIPIGQGFFVTAANSTEQLTDQVTFKNSQRVFVKESEASSIFMGINDVSVDFSSDNSAPNVTGDDLIKRIRIDFRSPENAIRPLLLSFVPDGLADDGFNYGYDAEETQSLPSNLSWAIDEKDCVIQGVGDFDETKQYPLNIYMGVSGLMEISLDAIENFNADIKVYLHDALVHSFTDLTISGYENYLEAGDYFDRFFITFDNEATLGDQQFQISGLTANFLKDSKEIYVKFQDNQMVESLALVNIIGQQVAEWDRLEIQMDEVIRIPVNDIAEGTYILKIKTHTGTINKKILISY